MNGIPRISEEQDGKKERKTSEGYPHSSVLELPTEHIIMM